MCNMGKFVAEHYVERKTRQPLKLTRKSHRLHEPEWVHDLGRPAPVITPVVVWKEVAWVEVEP